MLGHLSFGVSDLDRAIAFYDAALGPLGLDAGVDQSERRRIRPARARRHSGPQEAVISGYRSWSRLSPCL